MTFKLSRLQFRFHVIVGQLTTASSDPFHEHGLTLITAWISNNISECRMKLFVQPHISTVHCWSWEWMSNFNPHFIIIIIIMIIMIIKHVSKRSPECIFISLCMCVSLNLRQLIYFNSQITTNISKLSYFCWRCSSCWEQNEQHNKKSSFLRGWW